MKQFNVTLPNEDIDAIHRLAKKVGVSTCDVVHAALDEWIPGVEAAIDEHLRTVRRDTFGDREERIRKRGYSPPKHKEGSKAQAKRKADLAASQVEVNGTATHELVGTVWQRTAKRDGKPYTVEAKVAEVDARRVRLVPTNGQKGTRRWVQKRTFREHYTPVGS